MRNNSTPSAEHSRDRTAWAEWDDPTVGPTVEPRPDNEESLVGLVLHPGLDPLHEPCNVHRDYLLPKRALDRPCQIRQSRWPPG